MVDTKDCVRIPSSEILANKIKNLTALSYDTKVQADDLYAYFYGDFPKDAMPKVADSPMGLYDALSQSLDYIESNLYDIKRTITECK